MIPVVFEFGSGSENRARRFEAAILSRMRSLMTSRSNCAKDNKTLRVRRPIRGRGVELLRHRNKGRAPGIQDLDDLGKIGDRAGQPVDLVDDQGVDPSRGDIVEQLLQRRPIDRRAGEPDVIIHRAPAHPTFGPLAVDEGLANFALCLQRIEFRVEPLLGGFAGVDRAADGLPLNDLGDQNARARLLTPKSRGPDQCAPVIFSAITVSER